MSNLRQSKVKPFGVKEKPTSQRPPVPPPLRPDEPKQGVTFNKAVAALLEKEVAAFVTKRGTNRMRLKSGQFQFDYIERKAGGSADPLWQPCPSNEPTDDDRSTIWYPTEEGDTIAD